MKLNAAEVGDLRSTDFLGHEFACECGRTHSVNLETVIIETGAIRRIPQILREAGFRNVFILADEHTYQAAGLAVAESLQGQFRFESLVYQRKNELVPDETALGEFFLRFPPDTDVIITVGTGVLNDLAKFASHKTKVPYLVVATAPSMDGFASDGAALIVDNVKVSYPSTNVKAIIGDVEVLKRAPMKMVAAGLGDMLGKFSALRDWKLGALIEDEYYCDVVTALVEKSVQRCIDGMDGLCRREDAAVQNLMEGLVLTGIAMSFAGSSRPASGSEHHLSHFWEMMFLLDGKAAVLHGTKVGIASVIMGKLGEKLAREQVDWTAAERKAAEFQRADWEARIQSVFKNSAAGILKLEQSGNRHSPNDRLKRLAAIRRNWPAIVGILQAGPSPLQIENWLKQTGAPVRPSEVGITKADLYHGILHAKEIRVRYTVLQLLEDLGLLDEYAQAITAQYF